MTTQINNSARYYTSLSVGSLQVGNARVSSGFSSPIRFGTNAGRLIPAGSDSVVIGDNSGQKCTIGTGTTIGGSLNLQNLTTGLYNTAFGWNNGAAIITGASNVFVGQYCDATADCTYGVAIGWNSDTRDGCTSVGAFSKGGAGTSSYNTNFGYSTGTIYMGSDNTAFGSYTLRTGTAGFADCCAFGAGALGYGNKTTAVNGSCAFGKTSLRNVSSGPHNSAFGYATGATLSTGGYNTLMGYAAGQLLTGSYNVIVGSDTIGGAVSGAVALGAGVTAATDTFSIALTNAGTTFSTGLTPSTQNGGYQNCPTDCGYLLVYFNGVARRILVYNNA